MISATTRLSELPFELKLEIVARAGKPFLSTLLLACSVKAPPEAPTTSEINATEITTVVRMSSRLVALALLHSLPSREDAVRRAARRCELDVVLILLDGEAVEEERIRLEGHAFVTAASTGHGQFRRVLPLIERIWHHKHGHAKTVLKGALILGSVRGSRRRCSHAAGAARKGRSLDRAPCRQRSAVHGGRCRARHGRANAPRVAGPCRPR